MSNLPCPQAQRDEKRIKCAATNDLCGHVFYCELSGKWKLTEAALKCPVQKRSKADDG